MTDFKILEVKAMFCYDDLLVLEEFGKLLGRGGGQIDPPPHFLKSLEPSTSRVNGTIHSVKRETYTRAGAATD